LLGVTFSKLMFDSAQRDLVCGFAASNSAAPMISCTNQHGVKVTDFMGYPLNAWGLAARHDRDGIDVFGFPHGPWGKAPDVEDIENEFPVLHLYQKMLPNTCGFGRHRGGVGAAIGYAIHHVPHTVWTSTSKESKLPTHSGVFGGYAETVVPAIRVVETDVFETLAAGGAIPTNDIELLENNTLGGRVIREHQTRPARIVYRGEVICSSTQGGGGYGDVLEREPERVLDDLRKGVITDAVARNVYCIAYDPELLVVDVAETERLREAERNARRERGRPWDEFHSEWSGLSPPAKALEYYGTWPDARKNREVIRI
jgi:N-methylhydantoinase B/oxoprolinase/acetone carboxylase alpha subunit